MKKMTIEYWGDLMCPFCYIGEHLLEEAIREEGLEEVVEVKWRSCLLAPNQPREHKEPFKAHLLEATGGDEALVEKKLSVLKHLAEKYGLEYGMDRALFVSSSDASRVMKLASQEGKTLQVAQALASEFFAHSRDLSDHETILHFATQGGLEASRVAEVLEDPNAFREEIEKDQIQAATACPSFIPTIYFNAGEMIDGVLKPEQVRDALRRAYEQWSK